MKVLGYVLYSIGVIIVLSWLWGIRMYVKSGRGITIQTVNSTMLFIVALILVPILRLSPFHLIWMFLVGWLLGSMSISFPFSLLSIIGSMLGKIACIGLNYEEIANNKAILDERVRKLSKLTKEENISVEEAGAKLRESGDW